MSFLLILCFLFYYEQRRLFPNDFSILHNKYTPPITVHLLLIFVKIPHFSRRIFIVNEFKIITGISSFQSSFFIFFLYSSFHSWRSSLPFPKMNSKKVIPPPSYTCQVFFRKMKTSCFFRIISMIQFPVSNSVPIQTCTCLLPVHGQETYCSMLFFCLFLSFRHICILWIVRMEISVIVTGWTTSMCPALF